MTGQPTPELPRAKRRRLIFGAVLRGLLVTTVLVVLYYLLPLDQPWDTGTAVRLVVGLLVFASTYFVMERASAANFTQPLTRTDALYFSVTVFATVGFGDIAAKSEAARVVLIVQMLGDLALLGAGARVLLRAVRRGQQRRSGTGGDAGPAGP